MRREKLVNTSIVLYHREEKHPIHSWTSLVLQILKFWREQVK